MKTFLAVCSIIKKIVEIILPHLENRRAKKTLCRLSQGIEKVCEYTDDINTPTITGKKIKTMIADYMVKDKRSSKFLDRFLIKLALKKRIE